MKKNLIIATLVLALIAAATAIFGARAHAAEDEAIVSAERSFYEALKNKDAQLFASLISDDALLVSAAGVTDKKTNVAAIADLSVSEYSMEDIIVKHYQETAVITYRLTIKASYRGAPLISNASYVSTVWIKTAQGWQAVLHQKTNSK
jgi:ketosteroid isomerase-like protein